MSRNKVCSGVAGLAVTAKGVPEFLVLVGRIDIFLRISHSDDLSPTGPDCDSECCCSFGYRLACDETSLFSYSV